MKCMNIEEGKLQDILFRRKIHIKSYGTIIEAALAFLSYIASILLSGVLSADSKMKIAVAIITLAYSLVFFLSIRGSRYSVQELYNDILSAADIHSFSLLVIKDSHGRYLLKKIKRWNTFLLPFSRTKENDDSSAILDFTKESLSLASPSVKKFLRQTSQNILFHRTYQRLIITPSTRFPLPKMICPQSRPLP